MSEIIDKSFKKEILIGLLILLVTILSQIGGYYIARYNSKSDLIKNRKIELTDRFSKNAEEYAYLSVFPAIQSSLKFRLNEKNNKSSKPKEIYLNQAERLNIDDTLRINYPTIYSKTLESELKATELLSTLTMIDLHFNDERIYSITNYLRQIVQPEYVFTKYFKERMKNDKSRFSEIELDEFTKNYTSNLKETMNELLQIMVNEYSN